MSTFYENMKFISGMSCLVSSFILLYYIRDVDKRFLMVMFLIGFWLESVAVFFFLPLNDNYNIICDDESHFVPEAPLCVMQSFMLVYSFVWVMVSLHCYGVNLCLIHVLSYHQNTSHMLSLLMDFALLFFITDVCCFVVSLSCVVISCTVDMGSNVYCGHLLPSAIQNGSRADQIISPLLLPFCVHCHHCHCNHSFGGGQPRLRLFHKPANVYISLRG